MEIRTTSGVRLAPLPAAPSVDFMAGEDGRIYSRLRHKGFGRWEYVDWHPVGGGRRQRDGTLVIDVGGRRVSLVVAQVVCAAFHGVPPGDSCRVRHLDGDPANNRAENLAWGTQQEAWADEHPRRPADGGLRSARRLSREDRVHLRWAIAVGLCSQRQAARVLGVALSTVQAIVREKPKGPVASLSSTERGLPER